MKAAAEDSAMKPLALLILPALALITGCAPAIVRTPCVPNPVMLGPVTRIAARPGPSPKIGEGKTVKEFAFEPLEGALAITTNEGTTRRIINGSKEPFSNAAITMTDGRADLDIRVTGAPAGSYFFLGGGQVIVARWINFEGNISEVRHGR